MIRREQCHQTLRPDKVLSNHRIGEIRHERGKYEIERPLAELAVKFAGHRLDQNEIDFWALGPKDDQCLAKRRSEEHTSELQSLMRISYAVFCLKKKKKQTQNCTTFHNLKKYKDATEHNNSKLTATPWQK